MKLEQESISALRALGYRATCLSEVIRCFGGHHRFLAHEIAHSVTMCCHIDLCDICESIYSMSDYERELNEVVSTAIETRALQLLGTDEEMPVWKKRDLPLTTIDNDEVNNICDQILADEILEKESRETAEIFLCCVEQLSGTSVD